jgi:hypothetical protein
VAADHPDPQRLRAKLDGAVVNALPRLITSLLNPPCPLTDERVWLIRNLHLDLEVNAARDIDQVARVWGESLTRRLSAVMRAGADGETALCFQHRAAYLARFLVDCSSGWAWGRWYYEAFQGLKLLPTSAAIRTAILDHPTTGLAALQHLTPAECGQVLSGLTTHDASLMVEQLARPGATCDEESTMQAVWNLWQRHRAEHLTHDGFWRMALHLLVAISREQPAMVGPTLVQSIQAVIRCGELMEKASHPDELATALMSGQPATLYKVVGPTDGELLSPFLRCPEAWVKQVTDTLRGSSKTGKGPHQEDSIVRSTPCGGLFLLLPLLAAFPWEDGTKGWPAGDEVPASNLLRFLLYMKCCGSLRAEHVFHDPVVRDLFRIPPTVSYDTIRKWQRQVHGQHVTQWQQVSAEWQSGQVIDKRVYVLKCVRTDRSQSVAVLIEAMSGQWHWAESLAARQRSTLMQWLAEQSALGKHRNDLFLYDSHLRQHVEGLMGWQEMAPLPSERAQARAQEDERLMKVASDTAMLSEEFEFLTLPKSCGLKPVCDFALSAAAQRVLRSFAGHLPGFGGSRFDYLYHQFLSYTATMEEEPTRRVVRLGPLPLQLILNMTGLSRSTYALSWLDQRPIMVFPSESDG